MAIPPELEGILVSTPDTLHGAVRFAGSRVYASKLFDYLLGGQALEDFLDDFPPVTRTQAEALLTWERRRIHHVFESVT